MRTHSRHHREPAGAGLQLHHPAGHCWGLPQTHTQSCTSCTVNMLRCVCWLLSCCPAVLCWLSCAGLQDSIKASQGWFMACAAYAAGLAYMMAARAASLQDFDKLLHLIYLANEILFKAMQQAQGVAKPEEGQQHLDPAAAAAVTAAFVPAAGVIMAAAHAVAQVGLGGTAHRSKARARRWHSTGGCSASVLERLADPAPTPP